MECTEIDNLTRFHLENEEHNGDFKITDFFFGTDEKSPVRPFYVNLVTYQPSPGNDHMQPCHTNVYLMKEFKIPRNSMQLPQWVAQDYERNQQVPPHPNILGVCKPFFSNHKARIIFPRMRIGSIRSLIHTRFPNGFPQDVALFVLREVLQAVSCVHQQGLVHKDISAGHIFLDNRAPAESRIRLAFGASVYDDCLNKNISEELKEISRWGAAPEVFYRDGDVVGYSQESDVWLLGVTALELAYGSKTRLLNRVRLVHVVDAITGKKFVSKMFHHKVKAKVKVKIKASSIFKALKKMKKNKKQTSEGERADDDNGEQPDADSTNPWDFKYKISEDFRELIRKCMSKDPSKRPSVAELLESSLFKNITMTADECFAKLRDGSPYNVRAFVD